MSAHVRVRRPTSPPPGLAYAGQTRFPHPRQDHDADEKRAAASKGFGPGKTKHYPSGGLNITQGELKLLLLIVLVACGVRLYRLSKPNSVVFDEVHFGKFASKYIKSQYFVDVHPPLAKLLITLAGFVFGYNGHFDFKDIGKIYEHVPYVAMRMVPATLGVATVPLAYLTLRALDCRATTALLASLFITFENGLVTQSRHILLDSPLIFFTALTVFLWVGFCNEDKHEPFTANWWTWLALSGLSLGAVVSCKWVGLFTIATVGASTLWQLWNLLGDLRITPRLFMRHFIARAICLILVPIFFYMFMFQIHFLILENSGDGDGFMSSEFQHTLNGRGMADTFADIALGSQVSIRHVNTQGGYLHSHPHAYPGGSKQQQITLYPHRDMNNDWRIMNATVDGYPDFDYEVEPLHFVHPHMRIKLLHISTGKHLHSHDIRPPVSDVDFQNEVSGYGMPGFQGDANDDWIVELEDGDKRDDESYKRLRTLRTKFRLRHMLTGCYLFSHKVKLPDWGYEQQEVTCNKNAVRENSLWYIETAEHPQLPPDAPKVNYKLPGFFGKFFELQRVMWTTNAGLTDRHAFDSRPDAWPRLRRGINFWVKDHKQIYLMGNPMIWWSSSLAVGLYALVRGFLILRQKRGFRDFDNTKIVKYDTLCGFLFIGWCLHYFPFFLMARQLFLHHYFPALYFAILLYCGIFDLVTSTLRPRVRLQVAGLLILLAFWNFQHFAPLAYGTEWTRAKCEQARWLKTWDFSCVDFYNDYSQYTSSSLSTSRDFSASTPATATALVVDEKVAQANVAHQQENPVPQGQAQLQEQAPPPAQGQPIAIDVGNNQKENVNTIIDPGKPEPGRDIFAKVEGDIKSHTAQQVHVDNGEKVDKEISSVNVPPVATTKPEGEAGTAERDAKDQEKDEVKRNDVTAAIGAGSGTAKSVEEAKTKKEKEESVVKEETATQTSSEEDAATKEGAGHERPMGPHDEAGEAREKVAEELFGDDE
ncbi:Dolichyl-phosphate-mannose--protein mannosyltransferase 1 [Leucoagaricus sp. SymC.cos]|nr:Dolichyl-phosphate-mannose--protein mannosyltransferase 1 [Leucoagaricus sp. SymC.cos]